MPTPPSSIRSVPFCRLWAGNAGSGIATWALPFVLGFMVSSGKLSALELGIFLALRSAGFLAAVPIGGVMADRTGSRRIIMIASLAAACGTLLLFLGIFTKLPFGLSLATLGAILSGMGQGACRPAYQSIVPSVVPRDALQPANAALSLSVRATVLVGPATATLIASSWGPGTAILVIACFWIASALVPSWPREAVADVGSGARRVPRLGRFVHDLVDGYREARRHPWFFAALVALSTVIATGYSVTAVLVPLISRTIHGNASLLTGSVTAYMTGALLGAIAASRWRPVKRGWWALLGLGAYGLVPLSLLVPEHFWIPIAAYFLAGLGMELFNIVWFTAIQDEVARTKLARVSALDFIVSYGLAPLGLLAIAPVTGVLGITTVLIATAVVCFGAALAATAIPTTSEFRTGSP
ncbi:MFS transporter [Chelatococcus asaccharovorans]|nr:MFS transporter [Chelatococcus asaccharovorans]MBS7705506.1 MFS transporter [Chelatococcus asaccharovorans]